MIIFTSIDIILPQNIDFGKLESWIEGVIIEEGKTLGEINYVFCNDDYLHKINLDFLQHDTFTDIITFPTTDDKEIISSEIFISLDRVKDNSIVLSTDFKSEFLRVVVHGILHLVGYDDKTKQQAKLMREKENIYINKFLEV